MNILFIDVLENLDIEHFAEESINEMIPHDSIENIVKEHSKQPSIIKLKDYVTIEETFPFKNITSNELENEIKALDSKNASATDDIPTKMLIDTNDISFVFLSKIYNAGNEIAVRNSQMQIIFMKMRIHTWQNGRIVFLLLLYCLFYIPSVSVTHLNLISALTERIYFCSSE